MSDVTVKFILGLHKMLERLAGGKHHLGLFIKNEIPYIQHYWAMNYCQNLNLNWAVEHSMLCREFENAYSLMDFT